MVTFGSIVCEQKMMSVAVRKVGSETLDKVLRFLYTVLKSVGESSTARIEVPKGNVNFEKTLFVCDRKESMRLKSSGVW